MSYPRPQTLKELLTCDSNSNSCSSTGFKSYPRNSLQRTKSKAASMTSSVFQALFKSLHFVNLIKKNVVVQREDETVDTVKIKDIIRWKSFRDLEGFEPSDQFTTTTTTSSGSDTSSSWCDSESTTSEYYEESGENENDVGLGKKFLSCVGRDLVDAGSESPTVVGPEDNRISLSFDEAIWSSNNESERDEFINSDELDYEDKAHMAMVLMNHVKETTSEDCDQMLFDFFIQELSINANVDEMIMEAKAWINNEGEQRRAIMAFENCVREMYRRDVWSKFGDEEAEIGLGIENVVLNDLLDELLYEF